MNLAQLGLLYVVVGAGCSLGLLVLHRSLRGTVLVDAGLVLVLWPLYAPFLLLRHNAGYLDPLERAGRTGLASLLPDPATVRALERRLTSARSRVAEIDALLSQPDFCEQAARERQRALARRGDLQAAASVTRRIQGIRRLQVVREGSARELEQISELMTQLRIDAEVVRLSGDGRQDHAGDLLGELAARLEGLDELLDDEALS